MGPSTQFTTLDTRLVTISNGFLGAAAGGCTECHGAGGRCDGMLGVGRCAAACCVAAIERATVAVLAAVLVAGLGGAGGGRGRLGGWRVGVGAEPFLAAGFAGFLVSGEGTGSLGRRLGLRLRLDSGSGSSAAGRSGSGSACGSG